jgi:hypothetical protein
MITRGEINSPLFYKYINPACILLDIFLSLLLWLNGLTTKSAGKNCANFNLMGLYQSGKKEILICENNIRDQKISRSEVIKHEYVHYVYDKKKIRKTIIVEPLFSYLMKHFISDGEKLFVFVHEKDYSSDEELEARFLSRLPTIILFLI